MVRQFETFQTTFEQKRRYSEGCSPGMDKMYIRSRSFGFKPIVNVWEERIAAAAAAAAKCNLPL